MNESKQAKSYTAEFKESAVKLAVESKRPLAQTARALGVSKDTLYGWVRQYHGKPPPNQESVNSEHLYQELKRRRSSRSRPREVRLYPSASNDVLGEPDVPDFRGFPERVL